MKFFYIVFLQVYYCIKQDLDDSYSIDVLVEKFIEENNKKKFKQQDQMSNSSIQQNKTSIIDFVKNQEIEQRNLRIQSKKLFEEDLKKEKEEKMKLIKNSSKQIINNTVDNIKLDNNNTNSSKQIQNNTVDNIKLDDKNNKTNLIKQKTENIDNIEKDVPIFLGGLHPLSQNQNSITFMPVRKGTRTNESLNHQEFLNLPYAKKLKQENKLNIKKEEDEIFLESDLKYKAGYYGETRITFKQQKK